MKRIIGFLIFLVLLTGCEKYVVEISNVTLSGLYVVDWVTIVGDEGNDTIMTYQNGETFIDSNLHAPFNNIETNEFNINKNHLYLVCEKNKVIDLFLGSGSTMVAAHQLNRKCYGMELDPKYCQVIIDRMHKLDPSLEIKINGKPYDK
jgi:hypothetical protein